MLIFKDDPDDEMQEATPSFAESQPPLNFSPTHMDSLDGHNTPMAELLLVASPEKILEPAVSVPEKISQPITAPVCGHMVFDFLALKLGPVTGDPAEPNQAALQGVREFNYLLSSVRELSAKAGQLEVDLGRKDEENAELRALLVSTRQEFAMQRELRCCRLNGTSD